MPVTVRVRSPAAGNGRFGVGGGYCRSSLWRNHWEGDRSLKASGGGAATSRHGPSVSPTGCHLPMASPQGGSTAGFARMRTFYAPQLSRGSSASHSRSTARRPASIAARTRAGDRKGGLAGKSVSVRVELGGGRITQKQHNQ